MVAVSGEAVFERIEETRTLIGELEPILQSLMLNDSTLIDGLAQMLGTLQQMQYRSEKLMADLAADVRELSMAVHSDALVAQPATSPAGHGGFDRADPELSLLGYLLPFLPSHLVFDVGANTGAVAAALVEFGYQVFAFEPFAPSYARLLEAGARSNGRLHCHPYAIGSVSGTRELLLAADKSLTGKWDTSLFHSTVPHPMLDDLIFSGVDLVEMKTLADLMRETVLPSNAAILKIDTEGADLEVVAGAEATRFAIVVMEFWDQRHPFGRAGHGDLGALVNAMRERDYAWHLVLYRVDEAGDLGYYCNLRSSVPKSWGNVLFFRDFDLFCEAARWCGRMF